MTIWLDGEVTVIVSRTRSRQLGDRLTAAINFGPQVVMYSRDSRDPCPSSDVRERLRIPSSGIVTSCPTEVVLSISPFSISIVSRRCFGKNALTFSVDHVVTFRDVPG